MKLIVLSNTNYKEKDKIYSAITENDYLSFRVMGANDIKSKFSWLNNSLTIADVELNNDGRYKYQTLKDAKLIASPMIQKKSIDYMFALGVITEVAQRMLQDEEKYKLFHDIEESLNALKNERDSYTVLLIFLARAMKHAGAELEVNKCVYCGTTHDIVAFSFAEGGFICRNCCHSEIANDLSVDQMKLLRYVSLSPNYSCVGSDKYSEPDKKALLAAFYHFINECLGTNLTSINFLIN